MKNNLEEIFKLSEQAAKVATAFRNSSRRKILLFLQEKGGTATGTEIMKHLNTQHSLCTSNLKVLRDCGIVTSIKGIGKDRREHHNTLNEEMLLKYKEIFKQY